MTEKGFVQELSLSRTDPELGLHGVDLHRYFPGIDLAPREAFEVLWERRVRGSPETVAQRLAEPSVR